MAALRAAGAEGRAVRGSRHTPTSRPAAELSGPEAPVIPGQAAALTPILL